MTDMFASESSVPGDPSAGGSARPADVTGTLAELERKLRELERELTSIGSRGRGEEPRAETAAAQRPAAPAQRPAVPGQAPGQVPGQAYAAAYERAASAAPPTPAHEPARVAPPEGARAPAGRLVDEALEAAGGRVAPSDAQLASLAELRRFRDRLERFGRELAAEYDALLGRVMSGLTSGTAPGLSGTAPGLGLGESEPPAPAISEEEAREMALFEGKVELGVGPFYDIGALGAFEQRLAALPGVSEAAVRRFEASHAVVDVRLSAPVALLRELRRALNSDFSVREVASGRILLTFDDA